MPRRYTKRPNNYRRRRNYRRKPAGGGSAMNTAMKALSLASKIYRMVNVEVKNFTPGQQNHTISNAGTIYPFCSSIPQGDGISDRQGDSIKTLRLSGRFFCTQHASATNTYVRVIFFRGKNEHQQSATPPYTVNDLIENGGYLAPKPWGTRFNTKILYEREFKLTKEGNSSYSFDLNHKLFGHTHFVNNSQYIQDGGIYMLLISNESTNTPTMNYDFRLTFTDN